MATGDYKLRAYEPGDLRAVAELQRFLLGEDIDANEAYLRWKYHDNPQSDRPWAVVAVDPADGIVGFRGFIPSLWRDGRGGADLPLLALADTCVHDGHRRRGLFESMTRDALARFAGSGWRAVINLSTSPRPAPGYIKMGWEVFGHHGQLVRFSTGGLWRRATGRGPGPVRSEARRDGFDCRLEEAPRPAAMAAAAALDPETRFHLRRDEAFYAWRFTNGRERYVFAYAEDGGVLAGFAVARLEGNAGAGAVIDWGELRPGAVDAAVDHLLGSGRFGSLSVWSPTPRTAADSAWGRRGFRSLAPLKRLLGRRPVPMPLLVRPLVMTPAPGDWVLDGRDLRDPGTWAITEICSDGA